VEERYHYDELSRLVKTETIGLIDPENKVVEFNYDKVGNTTAVITNEGGTDRKTTYLYDELNRLSQVTLPDGRKVEFKYDSLNRIIERINANHTRTVHLYPHVPPP
jgi:YD repeat-containing protein